MKTAITWVLFVATIAVLFAIVLLLVERRRARRRRAKRRAMQSQETVYSAFAEGPAPKDLDVDPLGEAEIYLAYGNRSMAIQILTEAALKHPERADLRDKLKAILADADQ